MMDARCSGVSGVPMECEIANILVVGTGGAAFCAAAGAANATVASKTSAEMRMVSPEVVVAVLLFIQVRIPAFSACRAEPPLFRGHWRFRNALAPGTIAAPRPSRRHVR